MAASRYSVGGLPDVTITHVALEAGVSERTVSRVLNASPKVSEQTRQNVLQIIERMNFVPSARARALASGRSFLIGLIHDDPNALVLDHFQRGIVEICSEQGYELVVHPCQYGAPDVVENVLGFIRRSRVDGVVVIPPVSEMGDLIAALHEADIPSVGIASVAMSGYGSCVVSNERVAARRVAQHFVSLGHSRIGLLAGPQEFHSARERESGFREGLAAAGIALPDRWLREGPYSFDAGLELGRSILAKADRPTAIFASNDTMAAGLLRAARLLNLRVPEDLSVAGFDDSAIATMVSPTLTTIRRPSRAMSRQAATLLLQQMKNADPSPESDSIRTELDLVARESTANFSLNSTP